MSQYSFGKGMFVPSIPTVHVINNIGHRNNLLTISKFICKNCVFNFSKYSLLTLLQKCLKYTSRLKKL